MAVCFAQDPAALNTTTTDAAAISIDLIVSATASLNISFFTIPAMRLRADLRSSRVNTRLVKRQALTIPSRTISRGPGIVLARAIERRRILIQYLAEASSWG